MSVECTRSGHRAAVCAAKTLIDAAVAPTVRGGGPRPRGLRLAHAPRPSAVAPDPPGSSERVYPSFSWLLKRSVPASLVSLICCIRAWKRGSGCNGS